MVDIIESFISQDVGLSLVNRNNNDIKTLSNYIPKLDSEQRSLYEYTESCDDTWEILIIEMKSYFNAIRGYSATKFRARCPVYTAEEILAMMKTNNISEEDISKIFE